MGDLLHCVATVTICLVPKAPVHPFRQVSRASSPHPSQSQQQSKPTCLLQDSVSIIINSVVETFATMTTTLKERAWLSGLVLSDKTPEWNFEDLPPLEGGLREYHTSVVLNHLGADNNRQTVVVLGGYRAGQGELDSVLVLNLATPDKNWREGPSMNKSRYKHAAVVCNRGVYVMGGYTNRYSSLDCIEQINATDLLQPSSTSSSSKKSHWTTLTCRLSTRRSGCCAVAVHNRYIVVMGGYYNDCYLSSVDIIDTNNHIVAAGPSMNLPRACCSSAVIGHRIFVVGGRNEHGNLDSVEYLDDTTPCDSVETKKETGLTFISFSPTWTNHSELRLSNARRSCAMVAMGSCLVVTGGFESSVEVLDTRRNRVWNLRPFTNYHNGCTMGTAANQIAVIGGWRNPTCATLPLLDKNTWCFRRLCEQQSNGWYHSLEGIGIRDADILTLASARQCARSNTQSGDEGADEA